MIDGFEIKIKRTGRMKTAEIQVLPERTVEILVPNNFSDDKVAQLIDKKRNWIVSKIKEVKDWPDVRQKELVSGESFFLFGKQYRLKVVPEGLGLVKLESDRILVSLPKRIEPEDRSIVIREMLHKWYKGQAKEKFKNRLEFYKNSLGVNYSDFSVKNYKSRWGSCSPAGHISLNWRLAQASVSIIDYVIVHELVHLEIEGHGPEFWSKMGHTLRDFEQRKSQLKKLHGELYSF